VCFDTHTGCLLRHSVFPFPRARGAPSVRGLETMGLGRREIPPFASTRRMGHLATPSFLFPQRPILPGTAGGLALRSDNGATRVPPAAGEAM
jgi:hypothetical protein